MCSQPWEPLKWCSQYLSSPYDSQFLTRVKRQRLRISGFLTVWMDITMDSDRFGRSSEQIPGDLFFVIYQLRIVISLYTGALQYTSTSRHWNLINTDAIYLQSTAIDLELWRSPTKKKRNSFSSVNAWLPAWVDDWDILHQVRRVFTEILGPSLRRILFFWKSCR